MKVAALLLISGCAAQSLDAIGIACAADSDCPEAMWCDLRFNNDVCRELSVTTPPMIVYDGFENGDQLVPTITVPPHTFTTRTFKLRNTGSESDVFVTVTGPTCLDAASETRSDGDLVRANDSLDADFGVDPAIGCASPATLTITATASGRVFSFMPMISIGQ